MSREEMQRIADEMTVQGVPIDMARFRRGLNQATDRSADGDPLRLARLEEKFDLLYQSASGERLYPKWRVTTRGAQRAESPEELLLDWSTSEPNIVQIPPEALRAVPGWYLYLHQPELYFLALFAGHTEWTDYYEAGGNLWDKVAEAMGQEGVCSPANKRRFYMYTNNRRLPGCARDFPWLYNAMLDFSERPQGSVRTLGGHRVSADPDNRLYMAAMWTAKEAVREGVLTAYRECGTVPYLIHHDGVIIHQDLIQYYSPALAQRGLRVVLEHTESGVRSPPRELAVLTPRPKPQPKTRFDLIEEYA